MTSLGKWCHALWQDTCAAVADEPGLLAEVAGGGYPAPVGRRPEFVNVVGLIVGQRVSCVRARKMRAAVRELFGEDYGPEELLDRPDDLRRAVGRHKATVILGYSRGETRGVGPWTRRASRLMTALHQDMRHADEVLWEDLVVRRALQRVWPGETRRCIERRLARYAPYRGCICYALWRRPYASRAAAAASSASTTANSKSPSSSRRASVSSNASTTRLSTSTT